MKIAIVIAALAACGDNQRPLDYSNPDDGGALRLVRNARTSGSAVVLDFVVGDGALTGYATGFDLPLLMPKVKVTELLPGTGLDPGSAPVAASARVGTKGPLAGQLVAGLSQKAAGTGAVTTDVELKPGTVLFTLTVELADGATSGVVFDGTAKDFVLPSGGLRDRAGNTVVGADGVRIGRLDANP